MKLFGNKNKFAIEFEIKPMPEGMDTAWDDWGCVYFWVNGKNVFAYENTTPYDTYNWHLFYLVRWFCDNLNFIMDENDLPYGINGNTSFEILDNFEIFQEQFDEESEEYSTLHDILLDWDDRRRICEASGASFLPDMFIRATNGKIEIQWDNFVCYESRGIKFLYKAGLEYVNQHDFFNVVTSFCKELLDHLEIQHPLEDLRASLEKTIHQFARLTT